MTPGLEGRCSIQLSYGRTLKLLTCNQLRDSKPERSPRIEQVTDGRPDTV